MPYERLHMPHMVRARARLEDLCSGGRLSTGRDLAIELRWPGDDERLSRPGACHGEAMRAVARGGIGCRLLEEAAEGPALVDRASKVLPVWIP
jgi:hypothetical protein